MPCALLMALKMPMAAVPKMTGRFRKAPLPHPWYLKVLDHLSSANVAGAKERRTHPMAWRVSNTYLGSIVIFIEQKRLGRVQAKRHFGALQVSGEGQRVALQKGRGRDCGDICGWVTSVAAPTPMAAAWRPRRRSKNLTHSGGLLKPAPRRSKVHAFGEAGGVTLTILSSQRLIR